MKKKTYIKLVFWHLLNEIVWNEQKRKKNNAITPQLFSITALIFVKWCCQVETERCTWIRFPICSFVNTDHAQKNNNHTKLAICRWLCALRTQFISHTCILIMVYICFYASVLVPNWRSFNVIFDRILGCHFQLWLLATRVTTQIELIAWCYDMLKTTKFGEVLGSNVNSLEVKCITRKTIFLDFFYRE